MNKKFVEYLRVSTHRQGESGLGVDAQREAVRRCLTGNDWERVGQFIEVESGRKGGKERPQLMAALASAKSNDAVLVIAKLDRLARDVRFFLEVLDDSGVSIRFAEFFDIDPKSDEGRMLLINMANFAEFEGRRIGSRTRAALAAAKARGVRLGVAGAANLRRNIQERRRAADVFASKHQAIIEGFELRGMSQREMVAELNRIGIRAARGGNWSLVQLQRVMARIQKEERIPLLRTE